MGSVKNTCQSIIPNPFLSDSARFPADEWSLAKTNGRNFAFGMSVQDVSKRQGKGRLFLVDGVNVPVSFI